MDLTAVSTDHLPAPYGDNEGEALFGHDELPQKRTFIHFDEQPPVSSGPPTTSGPATFGRFKIKTKSSAAAASAGAGVALGSNTEKDVAVVREDPEEEEATSTADRESYGSDTARTASGLYTDEPQAASDDGIGPFAPGGAFLGAATAATVDSSRGPATAAAVAAPSAFGAPPRTAVPPPPPSTWYCQPTDHNRVMEPAYIFSTCDIADATAAPFGSLPPPFDGDSKGFDSFGSSFGSVGPSAGGPDRQPTKVSIKNTFIHVEDQQPPATGGPELPTNTAPANLMERLWRTRRAAERSAADPVPAMQPPPELPPPQLEQQLPPLDGVAASYSAPPMPNPINHEGGDKAAMRHEVAALAAGAAAVAAGALPAAQAPLGDGDDDSEAPPLSTNDDGGPTAVELMAAHAAGKCTPCNYYWYKADGCRQGDDCKFCHLCPKGEIKRRKKEKVRMLRVLVP